MGFDHVLADPDQPDHLKHDFDSGDHLHPSPAGFQAMANSIPHFLEGIMGKVEPDMRKMLLPLAAAFRVVHSNSRSSITGVG
jgi:hypothetical protein